MTTGVVYVAYGDKAKACVERSVESLRVFHPDWPVVVIDESAEFETFRWAKVSALLDVPSEWKRFVYLDADTIVRGRLDSAVDFDCDLAVVPSHWNFQDQHVFGNLSVEERLMTIERTNRFVAQLQTGVIFGRNNEVTQSFYRTWAAEYGLYPGNSDQGAFARALWQFPELSIWYLSPRWNSRGGLIDHQYGALRY